MKTKWNLFVVLALLVTLMGANVSPAQAEDVTTVFEQLPNQAGAAVAESTYCSTGSYCLAADNFLVPEGKTLTIHSIDLWGFYGKDASTYTDNFIVRFYADASGLPGSIIATRSATSTRTATGALLGSRIPEYLFNLALDGPQVLTAGTYWIEITNSGGDLTTGNIFTWEETFYADSGGLSLSKFAVYDQTNGWQAQTGYYLALRLIGSLVTPPVTHNISGYLFYDWNGNGIFDTEGMDADQYNSSGIINLDQHCDGYNPFEDPLDTSVYTGEDGSFSFSGLPDGEFFCVAPHLSLGYEMTTAQIWINSLTADQTGLMIGMRHIQFVLDQPIPDFELNGAVSKSFTITGGQAPYTIQPGEIELPPGMTWSFDNNDKLTFSGTPQKIGRFFFSARFTDANGVDDELQTFILVRTDADVTLISSGSPSASGEPVTFTFTANRPDLTWPERLSPTGTVTFSADGAAIAESCTDIPIYFEWIETDPETGDGSYVYRNTATCTAILADGSHQISAVFDNHEAAGIFDETSPYHDASLTLTQAVNAPTSYSISGKVFDDQNTNGAFDTGEPGLAGKEISVYKACGETAEATVTTGSDGSYTFTGLVPGSSYCVWTVAPAGYKVILYPPIIQSLDADLSSINFGFTNLPLFTWTPASPNEGGNATFTAVAGFWEYGWKTTQPGADCITELGTVDQQGQSVELSFGASGQYQVCLMMVSPAGWPIYDSQLVTVANVAPVPLEWAAGIYPEPSLAGSPIQKAGAPFSDVDHLASCTVDFGDGSGPQAGTIPEEENVCTGPAHTYAAAGTFRVTFTATDPDGASGSITIDHVVTAPAVSADISLTKTDSKDPVKPGAQLVYTLTVKNLGPNTAQTVTLVDTLDRNTTYVTVSAPRGWACRYANYAVTCTSTSLTSGGSATIKITVTVNKTAKVGKDLVNNAMVSSVTYDPIMTNNTVVQKTMVAK